MIDDKFKEIMRSNKGCAVVMAGSYSDESHINKILEALDDYFIMYEVRICSAHKQADALIDLIKEYNDVGGSVAYIAVAGGTDALSGTLSFHALGPVISCPPDHPNQSGLTNPPGSANAYIKRPDDVAKFIAQTYAGVNPDFREKLVENNNKKIKTLEEKGTELYKKLSRR